MRSLVVASWPLPLIFVQQRLARVRAVDVVSADYSIDPWMDARFQTIGKMLYWPLTDGTCCAEDVEYFLVGCEMLESCRLRFWAEATSALLAGAGADDARAA